MSRTIDRIKRKKSYTLSPQTVAFLGTVRVQRQAESVSSVLEEILEDFRREHERAAVEHATAAYYSSLSENEFREESAWGEFSMSELVKSERP